MRSRIATGALAAALLVTPTVAACDREDLNDVQEEVGNIRDKGEEIGREVEKRVDQADTDGKDD